MLGDIGSVSLETAPEDADMQEPADPTEFTDLIEAGSSKSSGVAGVAGPFCKAFVERKLCCTEFINAETTELHASCSAACAAEIRLESIAECVPGSL